MNKYWYEIFVDKGEKEGTETIQAYSNLKVAKLYVKEFRKQGIKCGLDKWCLVNGSPENVDLIEEVK